MWGGGAGVRVCVEGVRVCVCEVLSMHNGLQGSVNSPSKCAQIFLVNVLQLSGGAEIGYIWSDKVRFQVLW